MSSFNLDNFPNDPGVYLMKNQEGDVIYVGKAIHLKQRIKQYFATHPDSRPMVPYLTAEVKTIDTIVVQNEKEALLLENTLIKRHLPKYNALLKDDKTFISLMINIKHAWPMIQIVRKTGKGALYFGPYTSAFAARKTLDLLTRLFPLRQCSDAELKKRTRPCLLYGIKRCCAPCVNKCTKQEYKTLVDGAIDFLSGRDRDVVQNLKKEMKRASENLEYERAGTLLKTIEQIEHVTHGGGLVARPHGKDTDVLALFRKGYDVMVAQLIFRDGKLIASEHYNFVHALQDDDELLTSLLLQLYQHRLEKPEEILVPIQLSPSLSDILGLTVLTPQKGDKKAMVDLALKNAKSLFTQEKDDHDLREKMLLDLQDKLHLTRYPKRIECFDTSSISGTDIVAAMVAFTEGEKDSKRTRTYKIRDVKKSDDYGALREVLMRRLKRAKDENDLPDLIIVDGGKGQLSTALKVCQELDIATVELAAIAKEEGRHDRGLTKERVFLPHQSEPISLDPHSPLLLLLQKMRDEVHDKAIGFHRKRRDKRVISTLLDDLPGIGPIKKKRLLAHFKSVKRIFDATDEELLKIPGITKADLMILKNNNLP